MLYVILDGVSDRKTPEYSASTPLEAALTPNLDRLTSLGRMGNLYTVSRGIAPESDAGVFSLLSYDPSRLDLSRGVVEALGSGMQFREGDLALRCNFATVENGQITDRRAGRNVSADEASELVKALRDDERLSKLNKFELKATIGHRCSLVLYTHKMEFSSHISNLDPAYSRKGRVTIALTGLKLPTPIPKCVPLTRTKAAMRTAKLVNRFSERVHEVLNDHPINKSRKKRGDMPANFLLMRDAGTKFPHVRTLKQKFGWKSIALADMPVELGIAKVIGMNTEVFQPERTLEAYAERAKRAREFIKQYDLVYVHLKGPDEPGHDGDFINKKKSIDDIDAGFFGGIRDLECLICVTADHSTPCIAAGHTDDPVPILISGGKIQSNGSKRFTESYAKTGKLGTIDHGFEVLNLIKSMT